MTGLPFDDYAGAAAYFGAPIPRLFFKYLKAIDRFCQERGYVTLDTLFEVFGILRLSGMEARYQQTPVELFPFASTGGDGIHFGFVAHTLDEVDYPSGELCPMDDDGIVLIGHNTTVMFQELLRNSDALEPFKDLITSLGLQPEEAPQARYDAAGQSLRIRPLAKPGWRFVDTSDGAGVFADARHFAENHIFDYQPLDRSRSGTHYAAIAEEMRLKGLYGSQLFYLKELYWHEWTNYTLAKQYLKEMLSAYEGLDRPHLYEMANTLLNSFDQRYR
ncbi:hypothetical protein LZZ85_04435 [Terrimonas sp. NA20]|uniref:Uncharacterized protein n=1 Tax=Terrimonas ginsenosidimutans TaxID=2908004 RepID=A0ABS9KMI2_9BACT|nr:hypothetical protein [Terrimonas ginsenosidimutans]MCG2613511.1 hypothetical protein [Terrimonas ginsenosidimutans]